MHCSNRRHVNLVCSHASNARVAEGKIVSARENSRCRAFACQRLGRIQRLGRMLRCGKPVALQQV